MPDGSMFKRLPDAAAERIRFTFDGQSVEAVAGDSIAAALLAADHVVLREAPVSGAPRGPFCMMGACFDCLVEVDGKPNLQACMTRVHSGMQVRRMPQPTKAGEADV